MSHVQVLDTLRAGGARSYRTVELAVGYHHRRRAVIYVFERRPEREEIVAQSEEEARAILQWYYGKEDVERWELVDVRGEAEEREAQ